MMRATSWRGILRKSFFVEARQRISNDAIALEIGDELLMGNRRLVATLRNHCQVIQILQKLFVIRNREHYGRALAALVGQIPQSVAHEQRLPRNVGRVEKRPGE